MSDGGDPPTATDASGSQGVQVGSGNVQFNGWAAKTQLDDGSFSALSPYVFLERLEGTPHDDAVDLFARATPDGAAEVLKALLEADESRVVAILADVNPRKAAELVAPLVAFASWLEPLPQATEEIARMAAALKWTRQGNAGYLRRHHAGYVRGYKNGRVYWHSRYGAHGVGKAIDASHAADGYCLGFPVGDAEVAPSSSYGTSGFCQPFENGIFYFSDKGNHAIKNYIREIHEAEGGSKGWLGFPVNPTRRSRYVQQPFEGGFIYLIEGPKKAGLAVRYEVEELLFAKLREHLISSYPVTGADASINLSFYPISKQSTYRTSGRSLGVVQGFAVEGCVKGRLAGGTVARFLMIGDMQEYSFEADLMAYFHAEYGVRIIPGKVWNYYCKLGAEKSWLGIPEESANPFSDSGAQRFERGIVYWRPEGNPIAVPRALEDNQSELLRHIGYPVTEEQPMGTGGADRIQFFDYGIATLRDGKREIWLRP